jgi:TonB family protein
MLELNSRTELARPQARVANKERRRLLIALLLLLVALGVVLVKDREFWFGSEEAVESDGASETVAKTESPAGPAKTAQTPAATTATATAKTGVTLKTSAVPATKESTEKAATPEAPVVVTHRATLPPLDVEVVAGDTHRTIHPGSNVAKVEIPGDSNRIAAGTMSVPSLPANAAERERLSAEGAPELRQPVDATYPLLGRHSRVQGSVVLQAVVGADGVIVDLRVLSGPAILTAAAQQAVRQWRFKPYLQNGQPVETKAKITVNFSIRMQESS